MAILEVEKKENDRPVASEIQRQRYFKNYRNYTFNLKGIASFYSQIEGDSQLSKNNLYFLQINKVVLIANFWELIKSITPLYLGSRKKMGKSRWKKLVCMN